MCETIPNKKATHTARTNLCGWPRTAQPRSESFLSKFIRQPKNFFAQLKKFSSGRGD
jgi:hypothetical protein